METVSIRPYGAYDEEEILPLYRSVGWSNYYNRPDMVKRAFAHSLSVLGAYLGDKLVGIIRVVGDGHSIVYIQDIIVLPECQRRGIGTMLLGAVMERYANVYQKVLLTDDQERTVAFYKAMGLSPASEFGCLAFVRFTA